MPTPHSPERAPVPGSLGECGRLCLQCFPVHVGTSGCTRFHVTESHEGQSVPSTCEMPAVLPARGQGEPPPTRDALSVPLQPGQQSLLHTPTPHKAANWPTRARSAVAHTVSAWQPSERQAPLVSMAKARCPRTPSTEKWGRGQGAVGTAGSALLPPVPCLAGPPSRPLPGGGAGDGAAGVHQHAPAVARGGVALHRLVEATVSALGNHHVVVLGLPGLLQGRLLLLVTRGH